MPDEAHVQHFLDRLQGVIPKGDGWMATCPAHEDSTRSLSIDVADDRRILLKCFAGCSAESVVQGVGLRLADLFAPDTRRPPAGPSRTTGGLTLGAYAAAKRLPVVFLQHLGLSDTTYTGKAAVRIPYFGTDGTTVKATQYRLRLEKGADDVRFRWTKGDHPTHYGLSRLDDARKAGEITIVEGTSDAQTCWLHDIPALGLSNADAKQLLQCDDLLTAIPKILLVVEPDQGGRTLVTALADAAFRDRVWLISLGHDKDVSGLYLRDPEHFLENWQAVVEQAASSDATPHEADRPERTNVVPFAPPDRRARESGTTHDVDTLLSECDLAEIPTPPNMVTLEQNLRRLRTALETADPLRIATVRSTLVVKCQAAKVPSPAALIDTALAPLKKVATGASPDDLKLFPIDEPWPDPVDGVELMADIRALLRHYLVLLPHVDTIVPLWVQHTYLMDCWDISPFLTTTSPAAECGKSTFTDIVGGVSHHTVNSSNATPAAIFRLIDKYEPTLILDEADTWLGLRDELRGILNSGHKRSGARVIRADGENNEPTAFSTWAPKMIAMIGAPHATLITRSILAPMRRKTPQERRARLKDRDLHVRCQPLRRKCLRWAIDHRDRLKEADPDISEALVNRTGDNWLPPFAIADEIGEPWATDARTAARELSNVPKDLERGIELLADIKSVWETTDHHQTEFLRTSTILKSLHEMESRTWGAWGRQEKPMTPQALARLLKPYGPKPLNKRVESGAVLKGYKRGDFTDPWLRYLPPPPVPAATPLQPNEYGGKPANSVRYTPPDVADTQSDVSPINTGENGECSGVAAGEPEGVGESPGREVIKL